MSNVVNFEVLAHPLNWIVVFLVLYFLALASKYMIERLGAAGVSL